MSFKVTICTGRWTEGWGFIGPLDQYQWGGNPGSDIFYSESEARQAAEAEVACIYRGEFESLLGSDLDIQSGEGRNGGSSLRWRR